MARAVTLHTYGLAGTIWIRPLFSVWVWWGGSIPRQIYSNMSFRFNFGGDDSEDDDVPAPPIVTVKAPAPAVRIPKYHTLEDLVHTPRGEGCHSSRAC